MYSHALNSVKRAGPLAAAAGMIGFGLGAYAALPADTIAARQANFKQMSGAMRAIGEQIKSPTPDNAAIQAGAVAIEQAAGKVTGYFPQGSGPQPGVKTAALPAIWDKPDEFNGDAAKLVQAAAALRGAADSANVDQVKARFMAVGDTCKGCHEAFREPQN